MKRIDLPNTDKGGILVVEDSDFPVTLARIEAEHERLGCGIQMYSCRPGKKFEDLLFIDFGEGPMTFRTRETLKGRIAIEHIRRRT